MAKMYYPQSDEYELIHLTRSFRRLITAIQSGFRKILSGEHSQIGGYYAQDQIPGRV
jgi:hypothetical protein